MQARVLGSACWGVSGVNLGVVVACQAQRLTGVLGPIKFSLQWAPDAPVCRSVQAARSAVTGGRFWESCASLEAERLWECMLLSLNAFTTNGIGAERERAYCKRLQTEGVT